MKIPPRTHVTFFLVFAMALAVSFSPTLTTSVSQPFVPLAATEQSIFQPEYTLPNLRFAVDVAYSYRTAKLAKNEIEGMSDDEWREFANRGRSGIAYSVGITPFFNTRFGLGAKFVGNHYRSRGFGLTDKVNTYYIAPEFLVRLPTRSFKNAWIISLSAGYVAYNEKVFIGDTVAKLNKGGFKSMFEAGFDFRLERNLFMGVKLAMGGGTIKFKSGGKTHRESLEAFEIGAGLRF